ncbi:glycosyl hydrolase [Flavobacterium franklandianum]|uniref:Glycosyl hydrolase n=1 Tax=Flavobacterium franklandianum TaxID=2594430 RepID=A0A553CLE4_9FLAO|nr:glycoside hydrolase family 30 protein [Flavobacterium franklandianum]TRX21254.1 glycosyl hydrolase [Flavobacterium franklandianum]TRX30096.1 glycosyl hydrolase [Flavobacterium franklandianum]
MKATISALILLVAFSAFSQQKSKMQSKPFSVNGKTVVVYTSADSTNLRITNTDNLKFSVLKQPVETQTCVFVDPNKTFQTFLGIGGAITDASAEVFAKLSQKKQQELLNAYFSKDKGIGYSLIRTNIHSCDFSSDMYTYIDEGDADLKTFSIEHDKKFKIPLIKKATETAGGKLTLFVSPWSPPAFMKDNKNMLKGGKLLPEFYQSWANYYVKFINSYQKEGMPVWGLTIQNEPMAKQTWESCVYTAEEERDFLKNYLGPTLSKAGLGDKKITVWDHNRDLMTQRATTILDDPEANKYVWGVGFHWYETWAGGDPMFENVGAVKEMYPNINLLFTEGCNEKFDANKYQLWKNGERYGKSMINDFNNGTVGWTDWNILLDEKGGPNHVGNFCFAPIHADTKTGELIYTPSYYFIGHFSKFIGKNAKRISSVSSRSQLITTSFLNQDGKVITVVMNQSNKKVTYNLCIGTNATEVSILPHAIQTLVY